MTNDQIALARRAVACKPWMWIGGMRTMCGVRVIEGGYDYLIGHRQGATSAGGGWVDTGDAVGFLPDLTDPATIGCLLALVREAWGANGGAHEVGGTFGWRYYCPRGQLRGEGQTEPAALVAALEAAP